MFHHTFDNFMIKFMACIQGLIAMLAAVDALSLVGGFDGFRKQVRLACANFQIH